MNYLLLLKKVAATIVFIGIFCNIFSAEQDTSAIDEQKTDSITSLDRIVVTATRTKRLMSQTPASVSVIDQDVIDISPAKNIDDLLVAETGVQMRRVVGMGEGIPSDIIMRGIPGSFASSRTLILIDGIPTNASGTPFLILNEVPLDAVKNIEIVRGPYSGLYGANAFGGVINILTKEGYGRPGIAASLETAYPFTTMHKYFVNELYMRPALKESGRETLWNVNVTSSGGNERINYLVSGGYRNVGNYLLRDSAIVRNGNIIAPKNSENHDYRDYRFFGKCGVTVGDRTDITLHARYFNSELGFGRTKKLKPDSLDIITCGKRFLVGPFVKVSLSDDFDLKIGGYFRNFVGEFWNEEPLPDESYVPGYWKSSSNEWQVETQAVFIWGKSQVITGGIEYLKNRIDFGAKKNAKTNEIIPRSYGTDTAISNIGVYFQDEISLLLKSLNIVPGIRLDYHSAFHSAISPKLGISYKIIDQIRIRSSAGRAFRAPTLSELYMPDLTIDPEFVLVANPDLQPEYIWAVDLGLDIMPIPSVRTQICLFYNMMRDLICPQIVFEPDTAVSHKNISKAWSRGIEFDAEWKPLKWLDLSANYVLQDSRDEHIGDVRKKFGEKPYEVSLDYIPNHTVNMILYVKKNINKLSIGGTIQESFVGKKTFLDWTASGDQGLQLLLDEGGKVYALPPEVKLHSYWRTDLGIKVCYINRVWIALNIQNLFNAEFEESGGTLAPGRFATIKIGGEL